VSELLPADFFPMSYPFPKPAGPGKAEAAHSGAPTESNPFALPPEYAKALQQRRQQALRSRDIIDQANLTSEQQSLLQKKVEAAFQEWLSVPSNNTYQHLANLVKLDDLHNV
jgi:hypothetical protein